MIFSFGWHEKHKIHPEYEYHYSLVRIVEHIPHKKNVHILGMCSSHALRSREIAFVMCGIDLMAKGTAGRIPRSGIMRLHILFSYFSTYILHTIYNCDIIIIVQFKTEFCLINCTIWVPISTRMEYKEEGSTRLVDCTVFVCWSFFCIDFNA